jgi:WD40 repeat protein
VINLGPKNSIYAVSYSPDGRLLAVGSQDSEVTLWDIANPRRPRRLAVLRDFNNAVYSTVISPDGHTLAAGSQDDMVRLWDIATPSHPRLLAPPLAGPTDTVYQVGISPDGRMLAGATTGGEVWLWNIADPARPQALATLHAASGALYDLTFSPDDRTFVVGGDLQTMTFWHDRPNPVIRRICAFAGTRITKTEWDRYLPGVAYDPPCR